MTVQSPDQTSMCFSRWQRWDRSWVSGGKSCSQFPISLFLVQCKCRSMGLDVYLTPHALIQRGQEIGAWMLLLWQMGMCWIAHIVRQGALGLEVVLTSLSLSGFCLELQTQRTVQTVTLSCHSAHPARSATISSLSLHLQSQPRQPSKKIALGLLQLWYFPSKRNKLYQLLGEKVKRNGNVSPRLWKNTSPKRKPWHLSSFKYTDRSVQGHKPSAINTRT